MQRCTPRLRVRATIAKAKERVKIVRELIRTKRTLRAVGVNVLRRFDDTLDPYMIAVVELNALQEWIQPVD